MPPPRPDRVIINPRLSSKKGVIQLQKLPVRFIPYRTRLKKRLRKNLHEQDVLPFYARKTSAFKVMCISSAGFRPAIELPGASLAKLQPGQDISGGLSGACRTLIARLGLFGQ